MDELRPGSELRELAGDPIVEAGADGADQVGLVHRIVGGAGAVHSQHPQPLLVGGGEGAQAHDGERDREAVGQAELGELGRGAGVDDAAAAVDHRAPGVGQRLGRQADLLLVALGRGLVTGERDAGGRFVLDVGAREVLGDVHQDRPGPAAAGQVERLVDGLRDLPRVLDHERVLDDRHRDAAGVALLEAVGADQLGADLAGEEHRGDGVEHRVADRRHQVGGAGARGAEGHAHPAGGLGVALRRVAAARLVADQDVADPPVVDRVVGGEVRAAGQAEHDLDALGLQGLHQGIGRPHALASFPGRR